MDRASGMRAVVRRLVDDFRVDAFFREALGRGRGAQRHDRCGDDRDVSPFATHNRLAAEQGPEAACGTFMRRMVGDRLWDRLPAATRADREAEGVALVGELEDLQRGPPYDPDRIAVPVLLAYGEHGARHHHDAAVVLGERFGVGGNHPRAELVEVCGVGHGIHLRQPQALADLVRRLAALVRPANSGPTGS